MKARWPEGDILAHARRAASYIRSYARSGGIRLAVFRLGRSALGRRIVCVNVRSARADRLLRTNPRALVGVYDGAAVHEELIRDLVEVLAEQPIDGAPQAAKTDARP